MHKKASSHYHRRRLRLCCYRWAVVVVVVAVWLGVIISIGSVLFTHNHHRIVEQHDHDHDDDDGSFSFRSHHTFYINFYIYGIVIFVATSTWSMSTASRRPPRRCTHFDALSLSPLHCTEHTRLYRHKCICCCGIISVELNSVGIYILMCYTSSVAVKKPLCNPHAAQLDHLPFSAHTLQPVMLLSICFGIPFCYVLCLICWKFCIENWNPRCSNCSNWCENFVTVWWIGNFLYRRYLENWRIIDSNKADVSLFQGQLNWTLLQIDR